MYIETRYFDNGKVFAKLHKGFAYPKLEDVDCCDRYVESIHKSRVQASAYYPAEFPGDAGDYESLEEWLEELEIELDDVVPLVLDLEQGLLVDITAYC